MFVEIYLIFKTLVVHPEAFAALVCSWKAFTEEMTTINVVPRLSDEFVVDFNPVGLKVSPCCRQFFIRQSRRMILQQRMKGRKINNPNYDIIFLWRRITRSEKRSRSNSFLTALRCCCSGEALVQRNHCWVRLGPTRLFKTPSVASSFSTTERSTNCTAESHCCLSWTERSSNVLSCITRRTSAAYWLANVIFCKQIFHTQTQVPYLPTDASSWIRLPRQL